MEKLLCNVLLYKKKVLVSQIHTFYFPENELLIDAIV